MSARILILLLCSCACINLHAQVGIITTIAGNGNQGFAGDGGPATNAEFNHANSIWLHQNMLYVADALNHRVRKIDLITGVITTVAGTGIPGYNGDNILATNAQLQVSEGVCVDSVNNIFIADAANHRIRRVDANSGIITTIAGNGNMGNTGDGGPATNAEIGVPLGMAIDNHGYFYFCDGSNNNIRRINSAGIISTAAGTSIAGYLGDGGLATNAQLNAPAYIAFDNLGNIIFSDSHNYSIRKIDIASNIITTMAGNGAMGYSGDGGLAIDAKLSYTSGIFVDKYNNIYFSDYNDVVRKIDGITGIISTVVGCGTFGFSGDGGPATSAELSYPNGIFLDSIGTMYIADYKFNNRIRKVYNPQLSVNNTAKTNNDISVFPNPANDELTVEYHLANNEDAVFEIIDLTGRIVSANTLRYGKQNEIVDIHALTQGMYIYRVSQNNRHVSTGKIIKQ